MAAEALKGGVDIGVRKRKLKPGITGADVYWLAGDPEPADVPLPERALASVSKPTPAPEPPTTAPTSPVPVAPFKSKQARDEEAQIEAFLAENGPTTEVHFGKDHEAVMFLRTVCGDHVVKSKSPGRWRINDFESTNEALWQRAISEAERRGVNRPQFGIRS